MSLDRIARASRRMVPCLAALLAAACVGVPAPVLPDVQQGSLVARCARAYAALDAAVDAAGVRDAEAVRIPGAPAFRVTRFSASFGQSLANPLADPVDAPDAFAQWRSLLEDEDRAARLFEIANLPQAPTHCRSRRARRRRLRHAAAAGVARRLWSHACRCSRGDGRPACRPGRAGAGAGRLRRRGPRRRVLPADADRLSRPGVRLYEQSVRDAFASAPVAIPASAIAYAPAAAPPLSTAEAASILARSRANPLAIPVPSDVDARRAARAARTDVRRRHARRARPDRPAGARRGRPRDDVADAGGVCARRAHAFRGPGAAAARLHGLVSGAPARLARRHPRRPARRRDVARDARRRRRAARVRLDPSLRLLPPVRADRARRREAAAAHARRAGARSRARSRSSPPARA